MFFKKFLYIILISVTILLTTCAEELPDPGNQDTTPPVIQSIDPENGYTNAGKNTIIFIRYDDRMDIEGFYSNNLPLVYLTLKDDTNKIEVDYSIDYTGKCLIIQKSSGYYQTNTNYTLTIEPGIRNYAKITSELFTNIICEFTVVDRIETYESKIEFTSPNITNNGIYYTPSDFILSAKIIQGFEHDIGYLDYKYNETGEWSKINWDSETFEFNLSIKTEDNIWLTYPSTNWINIRITYRDSDNTNKFVYYKFGFIIDTWSIVLINPYVSSDKEFDYYKSGLIDCIIYSMSYMDNKKLWQCKNSTNHIVITTGDNYYYPDITSDGGNLHLVAQDINTGNFTYFTNNGSGWQKSDKNPNSTYFKYPQIAFSTSLNKTICTFNDATINAGLIKLSIDMDPSRTYTITGGYVNFSKMVYDDNNHISHIIYKYDNKNIKYLKYDVVNTNIIGSIVTIGQSNPAKEQTAICLDNLNNPHVLFKGIENDELKYFYYNSTWIEASLTRENLPGNGDITAVDITYYDNRVHVCFKQGSSIYYANRLNGVWKIKKVCDSDSTSSSIRISVDSSGINIVFASPLQKAFSTHY